MKNDILHIWGHITKRTYFLAPSEKTLKSTVFEQELQFLYQKGIQWEGSWGSWKSILYGKNEKYI